jgi:hypothetical protein
VPRFGKDKDNKREDLDRQAAEEVERLTRRGGPPSGLGGGPAMGGPPQMGIPSPLEMMAERVREQPRPVQRGTQPAARRPAPPAQAFTPLPTGGVGSSFGPAGLSPGPRTGASAPPPSAFGGTGYDDDFGGSVVGPPVYNAGEPDEEEEMSITEMALMDHAARTGHAPEDLVMQYDASSAEEMRDSAMRAFYERRQSHRPGSAGNNPFAPAGLRAGPPSAAPVRRAEDPKAAGGALAQRLAARRRREEEEEGQARPQPASPPSSRPASAPRASAPAAPRAAASRPAASSGAVQSPAGDGAESAAAEGALARVLARRRQSLGLDAEPAPAPVTEPEPEPEPSVAPGRRHARQRAEAAPGGRGATLASVPTLDEVAEEAPPTPGRKAAAKKATAKKAAAAATAPTKVPSARKAAAKAAPPPTAPPARKAAASKATPKAAPTSKAGPTPKAAASKAPTTKVAAAKAGPPAAKARPAPAKRVKVKAVFCIECGEKNPAVAKFCFACGTRLAAPEG